MKFTDLQPGDTIKISKRGKRGLSSRSATVIQSTNRFIVVDYGEYKGTVSILEIKNGDYRIKFLQKGEEDMGTKLDVDHEKLLEVCREHGTGKEGIKAVMEYFGLTQKQAENQIYLQKIRRELDTEKATKQQEAVEVVEDVVEEEKQILSDKEISEINSHEEHQDDTEVAKSVKEYIESAKKLPAPDNLDEQYNEFVKMHRPIEVNIEQPEKINNADLPDLLESEEYPELKGIVADLSKQVDEVVKDLIESTAETVNHPGHCNAGSIEVIDYLQDNLPAEMFEGFCVGNSLKYLSRYRYKGGLEDLKKAQWYLDRIIKAKEAC